MSQSSVTLPQFLAARARASSDSRLAADAIGGLLVVVTFSAWRVPAWYAIVAVGVCFLGYGIWAIAERERFTRVDASRIPDLGLRVVSLTAAAAGFGAGVFLIMIVLAKALGRIIS